MVPNEFEQIKTSQNHKQTNRWEISTYCMLRGRVGVLFSKVSRVTPCLDGAFFRSPESHVRGRRTPIRDEQIAHPYPVFFLLDTDCLRVSLVVSSPFNRGRPQWVEIFEGLGHHVFSALCYSDSVGSGLEVLTSFVQGSQLRDAALRYVREPMHLGNKSRPGTDVPLSLPLSEFKGQVVHSCCYRGPQ